MDYCIRQQKQGKVEIATGQWTKSPGPTAESKSSSPPSLSKARQIEIDFSPFFLSHDKQQGQRRA
jgi:hypothetical protein